MCSDVNNPYFRNRVLTASPAELRLLLIEGCIRFLRQGRDAMVAKDFEKVHEAFSNARNVLVELMSSLRHDVAPDLCANMDAVYTFVFRRVTEGSFEKDPAKVDEAIELMEYDRRTWVLLMERLAGERQGDHPAAQADLVRTAHQHTPLSVQG